MPEIPDLSEPRYLDEVGVVPVPRKISAGSFRRLVPRRAAGTLAAQSGVAAPTISPASEAHSLRQKVAMNRRPVFTRP